jgi:AAA+ ATPase superfamily predicted ATPase
MNNTDFNMLMTELRKENFDNGKVDKIKVATDNRGFTSAQVLEVAELFDFDSSRYDFAAWAYGKTYDYDNFYSVANAFEYNNYKSDLLELIS